MQDRKRLEYQLKRRTGMSLAARERLKDALKDRQWWVRCWNCKKTVEGTIADLQGTCPHCGASFRERVMGRAMTGTVMSEESIQIADSKRTVRNYDEQGKLIRDTDQPEATLAAKSRRN